MSEKVGFYQSSTLLMPISLLPDNDVNALFTDPVFVGK
jgi:hypothetical protein